MKLIKSKIKIAITGHTGVIGTSFIKKYKKEFKFIKFNDDLTDTKKLKLWIKKVNAEAFLHFAAKVPIKIVENKKKLSKKVNFDCVKLIVEEINKNNKIKWFFFASTSQVYKKSLKAVNERSTVSPSNYYGYTKYLSENFLLNFKDKKKETNICIGRIFSFTNHDQKETFLIPSLYKKISKNEKLDINNLQSYRDFLHINDICKAIYLLFKKRAVGVYNISSSKKTKIIDIANEISLQLKNKKIFNSINNIKSKDILFGNNSRLKKLGWKPTYNIKSIIKDYIYHKKQS